MKISLLFLFTACFQINLMAGYYQNLVNVDNLESNSKTFNSTEKIDLTWTKTPKKIEIIGSGDLAPITIKGLEFKKFPSLIISLRVVDKFINISELNKKVDVRSTYTITITKGDADAIPATKPVPNGNVVIPEKVTNDSVRSTILDALLLAENKDINDSTLKVLLGYYKVDYSKIDSTNPYLKKFKDDREAVVQASKTKVIDVSSEGITKKYGTGGSQAGFLTPTNVADFLGTFIADRFKQEINIAFLDKFKDDIKNFEELKILMPTTYGVLSENNPYQYTTFFQTLREGMNEDLVNLPDNTINLATNKLGVIKNKEDKKKAILGIMAFDVVKDLHSKVSLNKIINNLRTQSYIDSLSKVDSIQFASIQLISALSYHLENFEHTNWVGSSELKKLAKDSNAQNIFLGLLLAKESTDFEVVTFKHGTTTTNLKQFFIDQKDDLKSSLKKVADLTNDIETYNKILNEINKLKENDTDTKKIKVPLAKYLQLTTQAINIVDRTASILKITTGNSPFPAVVTIAKNSIALIQHIDSKEYGLAFSDAVNVIQKIGFLKAFKENRDTISILNKEIAKLKILKNNKIELPTFGSINLKIDSLQKALKSDTSKLQKSLKSLKLEIETALSKRINDTTTVKRMMLKYGNFAVSVINAKSNDEAVQALEAAALPVGSYRIKRNNFFNISINAYGGVFVAHETFNGNAKPVFGATAPVGIYFGLGKDRDYKENCCIRRFGLFVSLLDVGSVFAFRLNGETSPLPELSWQNIIAPGINLVYNFPKLPLTLMVGYQKGPELRKFTKEEITNTTTMVKENVVKTVIDPYAGRVHISAVIDIPIFNVSTKANRNK